MADIHLKYIDSVYAQVLCEESVRRELAETLTYYAEGYKFSPKYKFGNWDGKISLIKANNIVYAGLAQRIKKFADANKYTFEFDDQFLYESISIHEIEEFVKTLNVPAKYESRDYQIKSVQKCLQAGRRTLISPTSSGKSFMIYLIMQWYKKKTLLIVPTIGLVEQMSQDFIDYGYEGRMHLSTSGLSKSNNIPADVVITTWQSLENGKTKMPKDWYDQFEVVFGDECFVKDSQVLTPDGYKNIQDLKENDIIINYCEKSKTFKQDIVVTLHKNLIMTSLETVYHLEFDNGKTIDVTGNHKFLTNLGWIRADELTEDHEIINT